MLGAVAIALTFIGCGASPARDEAQRRTTDNAHQSQSPETSEATPCEGRLQQQCLAAPDCIWDSECRAMSPCERLRPARSGPSTGEGDPCTRLDPTCVLGHTGLCRAYDCELDGRRGDCPSERGCIETPRGRCFEIRDECMATLPGLDETDRQNSCPAPGCEFNQSTGLCQHYAMATCPPTPVEAQALNVDCEIQPQLRCTYAEERIALFCGWDRPTGGRARPPTPAHWRSQPDQDPEGCPLTQRALEAPCNRPPNDPCSSRQGEHRCINGRWHQTRTNDPIP